MTEFFYKEVDPFCRFFGCQRHIPQKFTYGFIYDIVFLKGGVLEIATNLK